MKLFFNVSTNDHISSKVNKTSNNISITEPFKMTAERNGINLVLDFFTFLSSSPIIGSSQTLDFTLE